MIITLNSADFSANNIGQVVVDRDVSSETLAILAKYSKELTKQQQLAVDDFLTNLKSRGIFEKINHLFIPALAGIVQEAFYDVITNQIIQPSKIDGYILKNNGLRLNGAAGKTDTDYWYPDNMPLSSNCHVGTYLSEPASGGNFLLGSGDLVNKALDAFWLNIRTIADPANPVDNDNNVQIGDNDQGVRCSMDANSLKSKGLKIASNKGTNAINTSAMYSGISKVKNYAAGRGLDADNKKLKGLFLGYSLDSPSLYSTSIHGFITVGKYLTDDEMMLYNEYGDKMMSFL